MRAIWIGLFIVVSAVAQPTGVDDAQKHIRRGNALLAEWTPGADSTENAKLAHHAETEFRQVLNLDPGNLSAMAQLAFLAFCQASSLPPSERAAKWDEALAWNDRVIEVDPQNKVAFYHKGLIAWNKWYAAHMSARASLGMKPWDPGPITNAEIRADLQARFGGIVDRGIADLRRAIEIDPEYDDALAYLNLLIRERADLRNSKEEYEAEVADADELLQRALDAKKAKAQRANQRRIQVSGGEMERRLLRKVEPSYPRLAIAAGIEGVVHFIVIVGTDGRSEHIQLTSGHPLLVEAARDAVKQYIYDVTRVNGEPVEVVTTIEIRFSLR